jgi:hypothetical protein
MADVQTGFGPFVSFYLTNQGWSTDNVGFAVTAGGLSVSRLNYLEERWSMR